MINMSEELKTLKDITYHLFPNNGDDEVVVKYKDLRQEAIKHIKAIEFAIHNDGTGMPEYLLPYEHLDDWRGQCISIIIAYKHFFNITEEDLK